MLSLCDVVGNHAVQTHGGEDERQGAKRRKNCRADNPRAHLRIDDVAELRDGDKGRTRHLTLETSP